ncbi:integrase [Rickettsia sp. MEAM1 (Bemisia tabaci)]|uniref:IS6 family transposase n=1 Tax=Rickettsia sp. MEAM1 (Bemisia tabaci) TaxID=1182263 RepID=UPI000BAA979E|nr:IS6 family transposase [Rickettsia sp. MEAM1 (Bemisia tabaci)]ASX27625.1 integrase [Rickettsia sp. MEAM1 (Bemisia tabaci)]ASX27631.1 integrase [Rickettsia sp. MEAM1 (Bemisia tabaci)]
MHITQAPNRHRFPASIISHTVWLYHRFNNSYRDVQEQMAYRGIILSHETVRFWCYKFVVYFQDVISKRERKPTDKWHLDEINIKIKGEVFILWRAVDSEGHELEVLLQKRRNKKSAIRFLSRLLGNYPCPRVIVTDKLKSYIKPVRYMCPRTKHRTGTVKLSKLVSQSTIFWVCQIFCVSTISPFAQFCKLVSQSIAN